MRRALICLSALVMLSACGNETPAPEVKSSAAPVISEQVAPIPLLAPPPATPAQAVETLRAAYKVPDDTRSMDVIMRDGPLPDTLAIIDRCVEDMRYMHAVELACIGQILSSCPGLEGTTVDMVNCNGLEFDYWDKRLNVAYGELMALLKVEDVEMADDGMYEVKLADAVQNAQRRWIAFRDAQCSYEADLFRGGTLGRVTGSSCMRVMTARRAIELEMMISNHEIH